MPSTNPVATMTSSTSPPPTLRSSTSIALEQNLDARITHLKAEIANLHSQKTVLSRAILGSSKIQRSIDSHTVGLDNVEDGHGAAATSLRRRVDEAMDRVRRENDVQVHRLAFGVTAFPWEYRAGGFEGGGTDKAVGLGVRIDLPTTSIKRLNHEESFSAGHNLHNSAVDREAGDNNHLDHKDSTIANTIDETYILLFHKVSHKGRTYLRLHQHNVPKHIDVETYTDDHLPLPDSLQQHHGDQNYDQNRDEDLQVQEDTTDTQMFEGDSGIDLTQDIIEQNPTTAQGESYNHAATTTTTITDHQNNTASTGTSQNLHALITAIHTDLRAWHHRISSIQLLQHQHYTFTSPSSTTVTSSPSPRSPSALKAFRAIDTITLLTHDARNIRIQWRNGTLARLRVGWDGVVGRVVVYGTRGRGNINDEEEDGDGEDSDGNEERNGDRNMSVATRRKGERHVRMHDVERWLTRKEDGSGVIITELGERLGVVAREMKLGRG